MEPVLFQRHRVLASIAVLVIFALGIAAAVLRSSALEEAADAARQEAANQEAAQLKADFENNRAVIDTSILAAVSEGRLDDAETLLKKYRPVANGALDPLKARYDLALARRGDRSSRPPRAQKENPAAAGSLLSR